MPKTALIVVDMLNAYEHPDAEKLTQSVENVLPTIGELIDDSDLTVYVNDNFGDWNSSVDELLEAGLEGERPDLVEPLKPPGDASFVIKARHTIFYGTPLEHLLYTEEIDRIVLAGQVTEQCILYSALDAYVRHLGVTVPPDGVAHIYEDLADAALTMMERNMRAKLVPSGKCRLEA